MTPSSHETPWDRHDRRTRWLLVVVVRAQRAGHVLLKLLKRDRPELSDKREVPADALVGAVVDRLAASWYLHAGKRDANPMTVWLSVDTLGWVMLQTPGRGGIACLLSDPGDSFNMPELDGRIEVERDVAVTAFAQHLGQSVQRVTPLWTRHPSGKRISAGFVAHYRDGAVAVVDIGDELLIDSWPSPPLVDAGLVDDFPGSDS